MSSGAIARLGKKLGRKTQPVGGFEEKPGHPKMGNNIAYAGETTTSPC
jgi:hypothetical protein